MAAWDRLGVRSNKGFTVVELLIVIVIIGILAALVIVAYSGIQQRANNTQRVSAAKEWQKLLNVYVTQEGKYPLTSSNACLGDGYPTDWDANPDQDCHRKALPNHVVASLNTEVNKVSSMLPSYSKKQVSLGGGDFALGLSYQVGQIVDGQAGRVKIHFWLDGINQPCGVSILDSSGNSTSAAYTQGNYAGSGSTLCSFTITDPANI